ncbi:hypothetical protein KAFR_0F00900 [Kazachstania africana CBS 2517]|uniref:Transcription factor NRM1 n=1 Tax=Kazachstania africana (strain ATCC 22294 / BCRC 22015 / CBS 2517 / CECT 1963 / NBRC 1671 / NRRL Y-8276) TaxID=1071382 RepID=H2AWD7_KAZAF|nr:hypothetical protein KAFR_0F00900 [Kazachstania africana CBS 2517]CCF58687.1 hypothetical protein KAFR_0F00900 [Kazachstania africana CBS 2517]
MSTESDRRLPLGELTGSSLNKLSNDNGVYKTATSLPSIHSLIDHTPARNITYETPSRNPVTGNRNFNEVSKKLQIRLQLAYYKYKTKQTDLKFSELKSLSNTGVNLTLRTKSEPVVKRRKLLVSHGNYKTPARSSTRKYLTMSASLNGSATSNGEYSGLQTSITSNTNTSIMFHVKTPIRNFEIRDNNSSNTPQRKYAQKQETPMSVKAAKSLLYLFTSNNSNNTK